MGLIIGNYAVENETEVALGYPRDLDVLGCLDELNELDELDEVNVVSDRYDPIISSCPISDWEVECQPRRCDESKLRPDPDILKGV